MGVGPVPANVRTIINQREMNRLLYGSDGAVVPEVRKVTRRTQAGAKRRVRVDTGLLRSSIFERVSVRPGMVVGEVGSLVEYALYEHEGTGIYGPRGRPIRPKRGQYLRFRARRGRYAGQIIFVHEVRGSPGTKFLVRALVAASPWPVVVLPL